MQLYPQLYDKNAFDRLENDTVALTKPPDTVMDCSWSPHRAVLCYTCLACLSFPLGCEQEEGQLLTTCSLSILLWPVTQRQRPCPHLCLSTGADLNALGQKGPPQAPSLSGLPDVLILSLQASPQMPSHGIEIDTTSDKSDGLSNPCKPLESWILHCYPILQMRKLGHGEEATLL